MSTPVKRKITLELNPNKKVLPKDRPSVFQRLGTKKFPPAGGATSTNAAVGGSGGGGGGGGPGSGKQDQELTLNKEEIVKRIVGCDEPPEPVPPPKIVPESVSAHARLIEAQLAAKLGKVIVSRGETIGVGIVPAPSNAPTSASSSGVGGLAGPGTSGAGGSSGRSGEPERSSGGGGDRGGHNNSSATGGDRGGGGGGSAEGWDQSSLENADQDILERKRKELQHELKLEMDASGAGGSGGGGGGHHHHHHHSSSSSMAMKQKSVKETLVVKKVRKAPVPRRRSSSSSDSSSSSGSDSSDTNQDSDSSSSSSSSSRDSRRPKKRTVRRRNSSSSSDGGGKKIVKKHVKKVSADGTKRIVTKKVGGHLMTTKIRVKKVTSPGGTSHLRKVAREVSPHGGAVKAPAKYTIKKIVAVKKDKHAASAMAIDARERVREKDRELALREKEREREKERLRHRERERDREQHVKSRSPRSHIRSRSPRSRLSPASVSVSSSRGGREIKKKSPEPPSRYREPPATSIRRPERSPDRLDDRRRHETLKDRERRERQEREIARNKEREEALARCQERQRERERLAAAKERERALPAVGPAVASGSASRPSARDIDGGLDKPDRHRPVERLLPRPAERARALAAARSPGKHDHDRSRTPNSPRSARDRLGHRERSYDRVGPVERGYVDHHDRRSSRSRDREFSGSGHPPPIVRGARSRDSPYDRHVPPVPVREGRDYREPDRGGPPSGYDRGDRGGVREGPGHEGYGRGRNDYPDDPPPRREHEREWDRDREMDRGHPPPPPPSRGFDRRGGPGDERRSWDREHHGPGPHGHGSHDQEPYQGTNRSWDDTRWKEADGWVNDKDRADWKYKERQWEHDDHPIVGAPPGHTHTHGPGGGRVGGGGGRDWPQRGHPDQNQGPQKWHGKPPNEELDFGPRHKLAGRLGDVGGNNRGGLFRRHQHQGDHQGPGMFHHRAKEGAHIGGINSRGGGGGGGVGGGRFGPPNKYSLNRTQQNLANQQQMCPNQGPPLLPSGPIGHACGMPGSAGPNIGQPQSASVPLGAPEGREEILPTSVDQQRPPGPEVTPATSTDDPALATVSAEPTADDKQQPQADRPAEGPLDQSNTSISSDIAASTAPPAVTASTAEKLADPAADAPSEPIDEDNLSEISDDPDDILTREEDDFNEVSQLAPSSGDLSGGSSLNTTALASGPSSAAFFSDSSPLMIPSQVLQNHPQHQFQQQQQQQQQQQLPPARRPFLSKARYKSYDGCIGGPPGPLPDLYANVDEVAAGGSFRVGAAGGEISQLNESCGAGKIPSGEFGNGPDFASKKPLDSMGFGDNRSMDGHGSNQPFGQSMGHPSAVQEPRDAKEAGKLHANKELKEEMDLDFEEISDGELEEENKFKGLGDALGVDWASLAHETRAKLKPEQTIPVSARNRWKAHHILLDIGISVRLAGEAYAQRVLTESKEKLREEIEEFKAAAAAAEEQKVAAVKREQEEQQQLFNGVKIKKEILDEDEQKEADQKLEQAVKQEEEEREAAAVAKSEQEANLAEMDKILHPVASVHVAMREKARSRCNLILRAAGPHSRALSARRDLEIRRQLCGFPPQECNERITEVAAASTTTAATTAGASSNALTASETLHETVMKLFQATMQPSAVAKIEVQ